MFDSPIYSLGSYQWRGDLTTPSVGARAKPKGNDMSHTGETLRVCLALLLAGVTALMTSAPNARGILYAYLTEALTPSGTDLGTLATTDPDLPPPH